MANSLSAALLLILCLVLCHGNNVVDILKPSQSSAVTPNPALGISTAFVLNYGVHPESLKNITATLQDLQIPFEVLSAIPFKHDLAKPKELIEPPPAHCFHNRTKMQIERVTSIVKKRKEFTWEKVSEWQTQLQLFFRLATVLRQAQVRKEQLQPFLILDDEAVLTPEIIDMLKPSFLHEELPNDWQLVVLDALHYTCLKKAAAKYCRVQAVLKLSGYIIRDMNALLALINTFNTPFPRLFDAFVSRILAEEMVIGYCVNRR